MSSHQLSVVMPAYNEGEHIYNNLITACEIIERFCKDYELVVVNDGSRDNTKDEISRAAEVNEHISLITYSPNKGKGNAIKCGVDKADGKYIAFLDSDLDICPSHLEDFLRAMENEHTDIVIGSKMHKESELDYPAIRKIVSFCYYIVLKILFRLKVKDTQTGIKLFKAEVIKPIIKLVRTRGYAYDIEILAVANEFGYRITERPIKLSYTRASSFGRIHLKDIVKMAKDTMSIFWWMKIKKIYTIENVLQKEVNTNDN